MAKHLTAVLILAVACCTGTAQAQKPGHPHPVRRDLHNINRDRHNLHQDGKALQKDEKNVQQDRQKLASARQTIENDLASGNTAALPEKTSSNSTRTGRSIGRTVRKRMPNDGNSRRTAMNCGTTSGIWAKT